MHRFPKPDTFKLLMDHLPQYANDSWHGIFDLPLFRYLAEEFSQGAIILTDLDHTAYDADAGFALIESAIASELLSKSGADSYRQWKKNYEDLPANLDPAEFARVEFGFYCDTLELFGGISLEDVEKLCEDIWLKGYPTIYKGKPLLHSIHPELAYLFALAQNGGDQKQKRNSPVAVTSSPDFAVKPVLPYLSMDLKRLCSMKMKISPAKLLENAIVTKIYGPLKVDAAAKILPYWDYAFGDNPRNDGPFLVRARKGAIGVGTTMEKLTGKTLAADSKMSITYLPLQAL